MSKIKVNILPNLEFKKPENKEIRKIQNTIWKNENIKELDFRLFAKVVGEKGAIWKSALLEGGSKNENFKAAYVLALDFDNGITIDDFQATANDLGLDPSFIYHTFSHTEEHHKFRAVWRLNQPIYNAQLKTALQLMLMQVFSEADKQCKDLSRLYVGGKKLVYYDEFKTLNLDNLLNSLVTVISVNSNNGHESRNIKAFCKKIGINILNKYPFMIKSGDNHENPNNIINYKFRENSQILNYDGIEFLFDTQSYDDTKNRCSKAKIETIKNDKLKKTKIDFNKLQEKCYLYNEFISGIKLSHNEIKHISFNLYDVEGYPTILKDTLNKFSYNNWENKYNTYVSAANYRYDFSSCSKHCRHFSECDNPFTIKEKYHGKEGKIKQLYKPNLMTLAQAEEELQKVYNIILNMSKEHFLFVRAVTGLGKTELLKQLINGNVIIGVSNHKLGLETFERLQPYNNNLLYVRGLNTSNMPDELKNKIDSYYNLGLAGEVRELIIEEMNRLAKEKDKPEYFEDMKQYIETLAKVPEAESMLMTHCRISFGNNNSKIDTIILDEDFLHSFINYGRYEHAYLLKDLDNIKDYCEKLKGNAEVGQEATNLLNAINKFNDDTKTNKDSQEWFKNGLKAFIDTPEGKRFILDYTRENKDNLNSNIFKVLAAEYVCLKNNEYIHTVNGEAIKLLSKYKVVVMSATIDDEIHPMFIKKYLPEKTILFKDISNVETIGGIVCNCAYAFSRKGLENMTEKQQNALDNILSSEMYHNVISFMNDKLINVSKYGKEKILHYGACEGIDAYKGQNLCVIGTPHTNSVLYEAYNVLLTGKSPKSNVFKVKKVKKYGFEFDLNTYQDPEDSLLTRIQLYMLYSQLIQAVGRARILRTNAKVYVFSAVPLPNSIVQHVNVSNLKHIDDIAYSPEVKEYINAANELEYTPDNWEKVDMTDEEIREILGIAQ